jgi:hypothetical protein
MGEPPSTARPLARNQKQPLMLLRDTPKHENRTSDNLKALLKSMHFVLFSGQIPCSAALHS